MAASLFPSAEEVIDFQYFQDGAEVRAFQVTPPSDEVQIGVALTASIATNFLPSVEDEIKVQDFKGDRFCKPHVMPLLVEV